MIVPQEWADLRALIEKAIGPCVLVGGCLRDLDNGRPVKDLDFFVQMPVDFGDGDGEYSELRDMERSLRLHVPGLEITATTDPSYAVAMRDEVRYVWSCTVPGIEHEVQIVLARLDRLHDAYRRVDFGMCMIGFDGIALHREREYLADQSAGTFTLYRADRIEHHKRSHERHARFLTKYPGWPLVDRSPIANSIPLSG